MHTLFEQLDREKANDIQIQAVADELTKTGYINRDEMYDIGLPACGRIKNVGGRIHDLRKLGWNIHTTKNPAGVCVYRLISKP